MRQLFSNYGLFLLALINGFISISIFLLMLFSNDGTTFKEVISTWVGNLI